MADVTGPIRTLPGSKHAVPKGTMCDYHEDRPATVRWQGETDSFGSEMHDLCAECAAEWRREARECDTSGVCDWCGQHKPRLRYRRDYEEGMSGPVYEVCDDCVKRDNDYWAAQVDDDWD